MALLDGHALEHLHGLGQQVWVDKAGERVEMMSCLYGLHDLQPVHGGRAGAVVRCRDDEGRKVILKVMLPEDLPGQVQALRAMDGRRVPRLLGVESELCSILLEDLGGVPQPKDQEVDLREAADILLEWKELPGDKDLPNQYERVEYWAGMTLPAVRDKGDREVERALGWALEYSKHLPSGEHVLHADLGRHNLLRDHSGLLQAVDPTGARGDQAYDAGALAVWGGASVLNAPYRCLILSEYLDIPLERIESWAAVRCALSAGFASMRDDLNQRADCLYILPDLLH